ncbi:helix-turn-helix domain-containing protein [Gracilibacillus oryzae]|uniref:Helix-turn-helix domain-containing protein n=1 Tax=Gracilibacillus oryzae TaxID=1672701 RepID=A0A7C8GQC9_9BACI|nr:helix-turn-helix domain-containing protein [Gracilibacillus oryzae]KAB8125670.1 helix-turn-helix domain-containing protein [Gracilibacillus oryzae]
MIGMNIRLLRKRNKMSQEILAERLNVSRQTIAKWENDEALPDLQKGKMLADIFRISLDQLSNDLQEEEVQQLGPKGKHFFGVVKVGERGQIVIPKQARDRYGIQAGDKLIVLGEDETKGIAVLKSDAFLEFAEMIRQAEDQEETE